MRIIKYLFLLLLLSLIAFSIFVATKKGDFTVERSKIIYSPKASVFNYANDTKNWSLWNLLSVEDSLKDISSSQSAFDTKKFLWDGKQGLSDLQTISTKESDSISQIMNFSGNPAAISMNFKDTLGGTKVSWKVKGKMGFISKIFTPVNGDAERIFGILFEKSLNNLDKKLDYEINTYSVNANGIVNVPESFYLAQTFTSRFSKVTKNLEIVFSKIIDFCQNKNISMSGKPFVIYHTYDKIKDLTKVSVCIPIKDTIYLSDGSDISSEKLLAFQAFKTTLNGDYSHIDLVLNKASDYFQTNRVNPDPLFSRLEIYNIGKNQINDPSKWITEIYFPIKQKIAATATTVAVKRKVITPLIINEIEPRAKIEKENPLGL